MNRKIVLFLLPFIAVVNSATASPVDEEKFTEFQANTAAKATEVNDNFNAMKSAINDNDTKITDHEDRLTAIESNPEAIVGTKSDANPSNHNRYSDSLAISAVTHTDLDHNNHNIYNVANMAEGKTYASIIGIKARGFSSTIGGNASTLSEISIDGTQVLEVTRSYGLVVLDRATGNVDYSNVYDIFGDAANAQALADQLATYSSDKIVIITTYDEPRNNRLLNGLDVQMLRCGASGTFTNSTFKYRSAYAMVGICDMGPGTALEFYSGETDSDTTAFVDSSVTIIDGTFTAPYSGATSTWTDLTLIAPYLVYANTYQVPQYRIKDDEVCLRGLIKDNGAVGNSVIANLPVGYRPPARLIYRTAADIGTGDRIDIESNGNIRQVVQNNPSWTALDGICFSITP